jgi:hypothetical protein
MFTGRKRAFKLKHRLTTAEVFTAFGGVSANALATFYDTNRLLAVTFTWAGDSASYTCLFGRQPRVTWDNVGLADVEVELLQQ